MAVPSSARHLVQGHAAGGNLHPADQRLFGRTGRASSPVHRIAAVPLKGASEGEPCTHCFVAEAENVTSTLPRGERRADGNGFEPFDGFRSTLPRGERRGSCKT